jgi:hypothetical protein
MLRFTSRSVAAPEAEPKRRIKKGNKDPVLVVKEAARVGDARFQYFVETGKLRRK